MTARSRQWHAYVHEAPVHLEYIAAATGVGVPQSRPKRLRVLGCLAPEPLQVELEQVAPLVEQPLDQVVRPAADALVVVAEDGLQRLEAEGVRQAAQEEEEGQLPVAVAGPALGLINGGWV